MIPDMRTVWQQRIERAAQLAHGDAAELMTMYGRLLGVQQACEARLRPHAGRLTGALAQDLDVLRTEALLACAGAATFVPDRLAADAPGEAAIDAVLHDGWVSASPPFYARLVLQPYAEHLRGAGTRPLGRPRHADAHASCPFCGGLPQLSILRSEGHADGGGRALLCSICATEWPTRRVLCAACGEEDEHRLGYFHAPEFDHLRVDTCETCHRYLKTVDLTRFGHAVPLVDEVAAAPLDLWATARGYEKIAINLIGL